MKHQVIVADDSQTIQKVISITLASEPFDIVECLEVKNLNNLVSTNSPKIVLLDFNLSEDKTGYDLCKEIKKISSETSVVFLFGTFDIIDEDLIDQCGASNWIVKPFDGNKFINLCRSIIDNDVSAPEEAPVDETEEWVMDVPSKIEDEDSSAPSDNNNTLNVLENSMQDWGIEIPGVIGQESQNLSDIPNVIGSITPNESVETNTTQDSKVEAFQTSEENVFPESSDLEYPEIIEFDQKPTVELTPIEELKLDEPQETENKLFSSNSSETDVESLKEQIEDETDDLWQLDEDESLENTESNDDNLNVHVLHDTPSDFPTDVMDEVKAEASVTKEVPEETKSSQSALAPTLNTDEMLEKLRPMIEELVKAECKKIAEKVSWEIIPDLAENLIKDELNKISTQVLDQ